MINILLFAHLKEELGTGELKLNVDSIRVSELMAQLKIQHPGLRLDQVMVAINEELASPSSPIQSGDTVALLPPVSGG